MYFEIKHGNASVCNCRAQSTDVVYTQIPHYIGSQQLLVQLYVMSFPLWYQADALVIFFGVEEPVTEGLVQAAVLYFPRVDLVVYFVYIIIIYNNIYITLHYYVIPPLSRHIIYHKAQSGLQKNAFLISTFDSKQLLCIIQVT